MNHNHRNASNWFSFRLALHLLVILSILIPNYQVLAQPIDPFAEHKEMPGISENGGTAGRQATEGSLISQVNGLEAFVDSEKFSKEQLPTATGSTDTQPLTTKNKQKINAPLLFIENVGQYSSDTKFAITNGNNFVRFGKNEFWVTVPEKVDRSILKDRYINRFGGDSAANNNSQGNAKISRKVAYVRYSFVGANPNPSVVGFNPLTTKTSFLIGSNRDQWHTNVPVWAGIRYVDLYSGIDLEITSTEGRWEWHLVVRDEDRFINETQEKENGNIFLKVEGMDDIKIYKNSYRIETEAGKVDLPFINIVRNDSTDAKTLKEPKVVNHEIQIASFGAESFPEMINTSVLANNSLQESLTRVDTTFAEATAQDTLHPLYSVDLSGSGSEIIDELTVDSTGSVYVSGTTSSGADDGFPITPGAYKTDINDPNNWCVPEIDRCDAFIAKISPSGSIEYVSYLGGLNSEQATSVRVDSLGKVYLAGDTSSPDFPGTAFENNYDWDSYVVKLNESMNDIEFALRIRRDGFDYHFGEMELDSHNNIYVTSWARDLNYPSFCPYYYYGDSTLTKINGDTGSIISSKIISSKGFLGGLAIDSSDNIYLLGTDLEDQCQNLTNNITFVRMTPEGSTLATSKIDLGGHENGADIVADQNGNSFIVGSKSSSIWGSDDILVLKLGPGGNIITYVTFGGSWIDVAYDAYISPVSGTLFITGKTDSLDFPVQSNTEDKGFLSELDEAWS